MNGSRIAAAVFFWLVVGLLAPGCAGLEELESLDPSALKPGDGVFVVRFVTSKADADDIAHPESDPDLSYSVSVSTHWSYFLKGAGYKGELEVHAKDGPVPIVRALEAGDYYFNTIGTSQGRGDIAVRFTVLPGHVTYIGDLQVMFLQSKGFLGLSKVLRYKFAVGTDVPAMMSQLKARFPSVPTVETVPMVLENSSML